MSSECFVTVSSDWEEENKKDEQDQEPLSCNPKFGNKQHLISITTIVTLLVVVLGAGLNLVWAQNSRLREMERDHEIRMKDMEIKRLHIKGMDHSRAIIEIENRSKEKQVEKTKDLAHSRSIADMKTRMEEQRQAEISRKGGRREEQQHEELLAAVLAEPDGQIRESASELTRQTPEAASRWSQ